MSFRRIGIIAVLLCVVACMWAVAAEEDDSAGAAKRPSILTGNEHALWLVHPNEDGRYGVVVRPAGENWDWVTRYVTPEKLTDPPAAGVAIGRQMQLLLTDPRAHQLYTIDGGRTILSYPSHERWSAGARPLAMCSAEGLHGGEAGSLAAVVAVAPEQATTTTTTPADDGETPRTAPAEDDTEPRDDVSLGVFQRREGEWCWLGNIDARPAETGRVFATVADGHMYVLLAPARDGQNRLFASDEGSWREVALGEPAGDATAAGMLTLMERPRMVLAVDDEQSDRRRVLLATIRAEDELGVQPLQINEEDVLVDAGEPPLASRLGDQVAVAARIDGDYSLITSDRNGRAVPQGTLDVFAEEPPDTSGAAIMRYFMWGIAIAMFVPLLLLRPKSAGGFFTLPQTLRTGSLLKRLAAFAIDALPFHVLGGLLMLTQVPLEKMRDVQNVWTTAQEYSMTAGSAYVLISVMLLFLAYCTFMELRFSATLGKMALGLRVCGDNGERPDLRGVLLRNISKIIETLWLMPIPVLLLWPLFNPNRQRIGDVLGRTVVVDAREFSPPQQQEQSGEQSPHEQGPQTPPPPPERDKGDEEK